MKAILTPTVVGSTVYLCTGNEKCDLAFCEFDKECTVEVNQKQLSVLQEMSGEHYTVKLPTDSTQSLSDASK